jgi:hypothetical protein
MRYICGMVWMLNCIIALMMGTEMVPEMLVLCDLTQLIAWEDFINVSRCENITSYII